MFFEVIMEPFSASDEIQRPQAPAESENGDLSTFS